MIVGVTGLQGNGKTALLAWLAEYFYRQGQKIYANFHLTGIDYIYINSIEDLEKVHGGYVFLDEFWTWIDSRLSAHSEINRIITNILMKARKRKYVLVWEAKFAHTIDRRIREHTDYFYRPNMFFQINDSLERIQQSFLNPFDTETYLDNMWVVAEKCFLINEHEEYIKVYDDDDDIQFRLSEIKDKYDTEEEIAMVTHEGIETGKNIENRLADEMKKVFPEAEITVSKDSGQYSDLLDVSMKIAGKSYVFDSCYLMKGKKGYPRLDFRGKLYKEKIEVYKQTKDIPYIVYEVKGEFFAVLLTGSLAKRQTISINKLNSPKTLSKLREGWGLGDIPHDTTDMKHSMQPETMPLMPSPDCVRNANESTPLSLYP